MPLAPIANSISGKPIPKAITNNKIPPIGIEPVCAMNAKTPANGAVTHGLAISVEMAPNMNAPTTLPPSCFPAMRSILLCNDCGKRNS